MGSAYLTELLTCEVSGDFSADISLQTKKIFQKANLLKSYIKTTIDDGKINLEQLLNNNMSLAMEANDLMDLMLKLQEEMNTTIKSEMSNCIEELDGLSNSLQEINMTLLFLAELSDMHSLVHKAQNKLMDKEYYECATLIKDYQKLMAKDDSDLKYIELYKSLSNEGTKCYEKLLEEINALWSSHVTFEVETIKEIKLTKFHIHLDSIDLLTDVLKASDCLEYTSFKNDFIQNFLTCMVNEIILHKVVIKELSQGNKILNVEVLNTSKKPTSAEVFANLKNVLEFISKYLNLEIAQGSNFLDKIGVSIGTDLINFLIKNYLVKLIPNSTIELEMYGEVMRSAEDFDAYLKETGFLPENSTSILEHANNINDLFVDKFSMSYLDKARMIMKKDLNKMLYSDDIVITALDKLPENCSDILKNQLNIKDSCYVHPKTQISKSAKEVTDVVKQIMLEVTRSKDSFAVPVFDTILNVFEIYSAIVPFHHKKFLQTIPLQAGLFHNNCLYFAYYLINLASDFCERVSPILRNQLYKLLEAAAMMKLMAKEKFEEHVTTQKNNVITTIQNSGLVIFDEYGKLDPSCEGSVRQCIRQLQLLENIWKDILPPKVYHRALGFILDSAIDEYISLVMGFEDIPCTTSADLVDMFDLILDKAPLLFMDPKEVYKHSTKWLKLNEFIVVLRGGLKDIGERWSDGMGPLANEFTPEEVKHLVRALFQNSERRSELLNRIK